MNARSVSGRATPPRSATVARLPLSSRASALGCVGVCGYLIGVALPVSPTFDLPLVFLVLLATSAAIAGLKQPTLSRSLAVIPVLGFATARVVSSLVTPDARSFQFLTPLLPALLLFFVLSEWVDTRQHVAAICVSLTVAGLLLAATLLTAWWLSPNSDADVLASVTPNPMLTVKNDITAVAVLAPLALAAALVWPRRLVQATAAAFFVAMITVIAIVRSRTALLTLIVAIVAFALLTFGRRSTRARSVLVMLAGIAVLAVAVDALGGFPFAHKVAADWQGSGRVALWAAALAMFRDAPVLGHGPNTFVLHYRAYLDALQLPAWIHVDPRVTPWAHNLYLELLAEQGVVGFLAFLALGVTGLWMVRRTILSPDRQLHYLGAGVGAAFIAFLTAAFFELSLIRAWVTIILFTLLGLLSALTRFAKGASTCAAS